MAFWSPRKIAIQDTKGKPGVSKPRASKDHKRALSRYAIASFIAVNGSFGRPTNTALA